MDQELRHKIEQEETKLIIALYLESYALKDLHSLAVCRALRTKYPRLAKIFEDIHAA